MMIRMLPRIRFRIASILALTAMVAICISYRNLRLHYLVSRMSNADITAIVETEFKLSGASQRIIEEYGLEAREKLKSLLSDPARFASAHLVLSKVTRMTGGGTHGKSPGNYHVSNLHYHRDETSKVHFHIDDNKHLRQYWFDFVGNHTGCFIIDEETDGVIWLDDIRPK